MEDTRNVTDDLKGMPHDEIIQLLDERGVQLEVAIDNRVRDYNMGTIVRTANAFGVRTVHIIGRRQWNKRGAMKTESYMTVRYHESAAEFRRAINGKQLAAVDIVEGAKSITDVTKQPDAVLLFGAEGPGISPSLLQLADDIVMLPQRGSTRSINVGVAAGIAMWEWVRGSAS